MAEDKKMQREEYLNKTFNEIKNKIAPQTIKDLCDLEKITAVDFDLKLRRIVEKHFTGSFLNDSSDSRLVAYMFYHLKNHQINVALIADSPNFFEKYKTEKDTENLYDFVEAACLFGATKLARHLINTYNFNLRYSNALPYAAKSGDIELVKFVAAKAHKDGQDSSIMAKVGFYSVNYQTYQAAEAFFPKPKPVKREAREEDNFIELPSPCCIL